MKSLTITFTILVFFNIGLFSQVYVSEKVKIIDTIPQYIKLDSLSIEPSSIKIIDLQTGQILADSLYKFDFKTSTIFFNHELHNKVLPIKITYQTYGVDLFFSLQRRKIIFEKDVVDTIAILSGSEKKSDELFQTSGLRKSGVLSRGITIGNSQNASFQSSLNLQLQGNLSDDIEITAQITDNNIPVQPEGNTQKLQEFDKVFIRLQKKNTILIAGDYDLVSQTGYFSKYQKKTQGLLLQTAWKSKSLFSRFDSAQYKSGVSFGIARGKYNKMIFQGKQGNQGPYKLTGSENESFIVVLSGTERVYINGELLTRGQENDYVIDYNTAELTFTNKRIITNDMRIIVEFEYSDKNYVKTSYSANFEYKDKTSNIYTSFYSEQDLKHQPLMQTIDDKEKNVLFYAGDDPMKAVIKAFDTVSFSSDYVLYEMVDTLGYDSVFVYSTNPQKARYRLSFSKVGMGNGNYVLEKHSANGRVFKWVAPQNGVSQGEYEPVILLIAPKKKQMYQLGGETHLTKSLSTGIELAVSNNDLNTFSPFDSSDDNGFAYRTFLKHKNILKKIDTTNKVFFVKLLNYEYLNKNFQPIDPFRDVEFERNWAIQGLTLKTNQHLLSFYTGIENNTNKIVASKIEYLIKENQFNTFKYELENNVKIKKFNYVGSNLFTYSDRKPYDVNFLKNKGNIFLSLNGFFPGFEYEHETSILGLKDSIFDNSHAFYQGQPYLLIDKQKNFNLKIYNTYRLEKGIYNYSFFDKMLHNEAGLRFYVEKDNLNRTMINLALRDSRSKNKNFFNLKDEKSFVSQFEQNLNLFKQSITLNNFYETTMGMENKKEFMFIEVPQGQGTHKWNDYNKNGIKELDEFEVAQYRDEATYIRVLVPNNEYINVYLLKASFSLMIDPGKMISKDNVKTLKIIKKFSNRTNYTLNKKTISTDINERFNPFLLNYADTSIISILHAFRNTFYFNRAHPRFSCWHSFQKNMNKTLMFNGFETRDLEANEFQFIWNISNIYSIEGNLKTEEKNNKSEFFTLRNFRIASEEVNMRFNVYYLVKNRFSIIGRYKESSNRIANFEKSRNAEFGQESRVGIKNNILNFKTVVHNITYNSDVNSPIAYEMLEGLQKGVNFVWTVWFQYSITKNLQLNFTYEGRKAMNHRTIHFGSMQAKAIF